MSNISSSSLQCTLKNPFHCEGVGLHSGVVSQMSVEPADEDYGIVFTRIDLPDQPRVRAHFSYVTNTFLCTKLGNEQGVEIAGTEHLMAALAAYNIDNVFIKLNGAEIPFLDGSALPFMEKIALSKIAEQQKARRWIKVIQEIRIEEEDRWVQLIPAETFSAKVTYDFRNRQGMGAYTYDFQGNNIKEFKQEIAPARSFGFFEDAEKLYAKGLSRGASLENTVVIDQGKVMNPSGLRFEDEFSRHKILDAMGDLYLAGAPILGHYTAYNGGHGLHFKLLEKLFKEESFRWVS